MIPFVKQVLELLGIEGQVPIIVGVDNVGAIYLANNHTTASFRHHHCSVVKMSKRGNDSNDRYHQERGPPPNRPRSNNGQERAPWEAERLEQGNFQVAQPMKKGNFFKLNRNSTLADSGASSHIRNCLDCMSNLSVYKTPIRVGNQGRGGEFGGHSGGRFSMAKADGQARPRRRCYGCDGTCYNNVAETHLDFKLEDMFGNWSGNSVDDTYLFCDLKKSHTRRFFPPWNIKFEATEGREAVVDEGGREFLSEAWQQNGTFKVPGVQMFTDRQQ